MGVSLEEYQHLAEADHGGRWEYVCGEPRRKPDVTTEHRGAINVLDHMMQRQLDINEFEVCRNDGRLRAPGGNYRVPDLFVVPRALVQRLLARPRTFEVYDDPMPLVVEVWSPSTGGSDFTDKLAEYQQRHDQEIWHLHPYRRTVTVWRLQPDGSYHETTHTDGILRPAALPDVQIDVGRLFR